MRLCYPSVFIWAALVQYSNGYNLYKAASALNSPENLANNIEEFLKNNGTAKISTSCALHLQEYLKSLLTFELWAISMFDANAKIPPGLLQGNHYWLGSFEECLNVEGNTANGIIMGQYCIGNAFVPQLFTNYKADETQNEEDVTTLTLGTCFPSSCSTADLNELLNGILGMPYSTREACQTKENLPKLDGPAITAISVFGVILGLMLISTVYDIYLHCLEKKPVHPMTTAFSVLTNGRKLFECNSKGQITCLYGIRTITLLWVIFIHEYGIFNDTPFVNSFDKVEEMKKFWAMIFHGASPAVDTFFLMAGLVISYTFMNARKRGFKFNLILFYIHRYLRLTPVSAAIILMNATLLKYFGSGPLFPFIIKADVESCQNYWWSSLLYIQNFVNSDTICNLPTWYLSLDTQFYLVAPVFLFAMFKWPKLSFVAMGVLIILISLGSSLVIWFLELNALWDANGVQGTTKLGDYVKHYFFMPYFRATPWIIGLLLGYFLFEIKQKNKKFDLNFSLVIILWGVSLATLVALVFGPEDMMNGEYNRLQNTVYVGFVRISWSLSLTWIMFACVTGYGGFVNWFLSLPIFEILSRLVYAAYLIHVPVIITITANVQTSLYFSNLSAMHIYWGHAIISFGIAIILNLAFESPVPVIEKFLFGRFQKKVVPSDHSRVENNNEYKEEDKHNQVRDLTTIASVRVQ